MNLLFYHISQIVPNRGGVENVTYYWYRYFQKKGYNVFVIFWQPSEGAPSDMVQVRLPDEQHYYSQANKCFFKNYLLEHRIDVVVNQNGINNKSSLVCVEACASLQIPVVSILHNSPDHYLWDFILSRRFMRYSWGRKILSFCYFLLQRFPGYKGGYYIYKKSSRIIVLSPRYIKPYLRLNVGRDRSRKVMALFNPLTIPLERTSDRRAVAKNVLLVGRLEKQKAVEKMLAVWRCIEVKNKDWQLFILGDGREASKLKRMAAEWKLTRVHFVGSTCPEPYYANASILCLTSLYEGFPMVLLECRAYGLVPLCFDTFAASADLINDNQDGFLIPSFDKQCYADRLLFLMENSLQLARMQQASCSRAGDFDSEKIGIQLREVLESLVANSLSAQKSIRNHA